MTLGSVVTGLAGAVNTPGTQVTLTWNSANSLTIIFTVDGFLQQPDVAVGDVEFKAVAGGQGGGSGNGSASSPNFGYGGYGSGYIDAHFSPSTLVYPVPITIGTGGIGDNSNTGASGTLGTDTIIGPSYPTNYYVRVPGAGPSVGLPTSFGAISTTTEAGGFQDGTTNADTVHAGAAGGGAAYLGTGNFAGGIASGGGPGGNGGSAANYPIPATSGLPYGAAGGGGTWSNPHALAGADGAGGEVIVVESYTAANSYNIYRNGSLIGNVAALIFVDNAPPAGNDIYFVVAVVSGVEQTNGGEQVTVDVLQPPVTVPNLIGLTSVAASTLLIDTGLTVGPTGTQIASDGNFTVVAQGPRAGASVPVNTQVSYTLSVPPNYGGWGWDGQDPVFNRNVPAPAGSGGNRWGANGGDGTPIGGGVIGQTGWDERVKVTVGTAQRKLNYQIGNGNPNKSVESEMSDHELDGNFPDDHLPGPGSTMG